MGFLSGLFGKKSSSHEVINLVGPGTFSLPIVGEAYYQAALESICGQRKKTGENKIVKAMLILEDSNPHDRLAVRVEINEMTVGYLSQEDARWYRSRLKKAGHRNVTASCEAVIKGGWERNKGEKLDRGHYGVYLDLQVDD